MENRLGVEEIKRLGEKLRKLLFEHWKNLPENPRKKARGGRKTNIRVLKGLLPDWAVQIAELTFKDMKEVFWDYNKDCVEDYIDGLKVFNAPII